MYANSIGMPMQFKNLRIKNNSFKYKVYVFLFYKGGSVSTPLNSIENDAITRIGDEFYEVCEAKSQSGKTLWIGIQRDKGGNWTVSRIIFC